MRRYLLIAALALVLVPVSIYAYGRLTTMNTVDTYKWSPAVSAHPEFPAQLISGSLIDAAGNAVDIRGGKPVNGGWGDASGLAATGPDLKPVPVRLDLSYFSYVDDRFYGGTVALPAETLRNRLADGFENQREGRQGRYVTLVVGMGAGGNLSVWLAGEGHVHEVTTADLPQIEMDWTEFRPESRHSRADYIGLVLSELGQTAAGAENGAERFARFRQRHGWSIVLESDGPPGTLQLSYFNGERDLLNLMRPHALRADLAAPRDARLTWTGTDGQKYAATLAFDEAETLAAFETLGREPVGDLRLELRIADTNRSLLAVLRDDARFLAFENVATEIYRRRD